MREIWVSAKRWMTMSWKGLREWCGDSAYENYKHCAARKAQGHVLSAAEFYVEQLNRRYSRPNRCC
jgi:uncharacterized short protein YbdD (DUF466 family)